MTALLFLLAAASASLSSAAALVGLALALAIYAWAESGWLREPREACFAGRHREIEAARVVESGTGSPAEFDLATTSGQIGDPAPLAFPTPAGEVRVASLYLYRGKLRFRRVAK